MKYNRKMLGPPMVGASGLRDILLHRTVVKKQKIPDKIGLASQMSKVRI